MTTPVPTVKERRRRYRDEMVEDILRMAAELMRRDGVAALSFNEIARSLGMQPPSLYHYFASKNAIYDELFRRGFVELGQHMDVQLRQEGTLRQKLHGAVQSYMAFAQENPDLYQLMFQRPVPDFTPSAESMAASLAALQTARTQFAAVLHSEALNLHAPLDEALDLFIACQHGLTELHLANNPELPAGKGRFGKLIPLAVQLFLDSWQGS